MSAFMMLAVGPTMQQRSGDQSFHAVANGDRARGEKRWRGEMMAAKAPMATAPAMARPRNSTEASASPVGGQIGVALAFSEAKSRLRRASTT
jgi:hypothetical protein